MNILEKAEEEILDPIIGAVGVIATCAVIWFGGKYVLNKNSEANDTKALTDKKNKKKADTTLLLGE